MCLLYRAVRAVPRIGALLLASQLIDPAEATIRDGGIDPSNLGKGDWIYQMNQAVAQCNGNVPSVTDVPSLMIYLKNQGVRYIIVKAGTGASLFSTTGFSPQFSSGLVNSAHAAGLWIFGYNRSYATNTAGEAAIADFVFQQGADGFVWDAEAEWEYSRIGSQGPALAIAQCSLVRSNWPNKFLAHAPFAYISGHGSFPYKEFGYYCDAAMPQDYWVEFGSTPTATVTKMSSDWRNWQSGLSGQWVNSIKPIVPDGQGYNGSGTVTAAQITEFVNALKSDPSPATAGGYKGVNYWVCEDHPPDVWGAIAANNIGTVPINSAPVIANVSAGNINSSSATITWTTDQITDSVVEYGLDASYGTAVTSSTMFYYHTVPLAGLSGNTTYHYRVKSKNSYNKQGISGDYVLTTAAATVADVIVESRAGGLNYAAYSEVGVFPNAWSDSTAKSIASGCTGGIGSRYNSSTGVGGAATWFQVSPTLEAAGGQYQVWVTVGASSAGSVVTSTITGTGWTGLPPTTDTFNNASINAWRLVGTLTLNSGVTTPTVRFDETANNNRFYADAVKFHYLPPPPTAPTITTPPQSQTNNQGNAATFSVIASGTPLLFYQWRFNGTNIAGATLSSYTRYALQASDAGSYSVFITNGVGPATSSSAVLTVIVPPTIMIQPADAGVGLGMNATFSVTAVGTPSLQYQWQFNGTNLAGATASTLTVHNVQSSNAGPYDVVVSSTYGADNSDLAFLNYLDPCFATQPQSQSVAPGATAVFNASAVGTQPMGYQWMKEGASLVDGGNISGARTASLTVSNAQWGDVGNYSLMASNVSGWAVSSNATLIGSFPPDIVTQPAPMTALAGSAVSFTVGALGVGPFTFRWKRAGTNLVDGGKISGAATASLMVSNVQAADMVGYSVVVSNAYGGVTSSNALLTLWPLAAWGFDSYGQSDVPDGLSNVLAVAGGYYHSLALKLDGTVAVWGSGASGQTNVPAGLTNVTAVAAGVFHGLAAKADGTVAAWGYNDSGQTNVPAELANVVAVAGGSSHSLALKTDRTVAAWGANSYGQTNIPSGLTNAVAVAAGWYHNLALRGDGTVVAWGAGTTNAGASPHWGQALVPNGLSNVVAIAAGAYHSLALKADGTVVAWGAGTTNAGSSPLWGQAIVPDGLTNVVAIAGGLYHSLAVRADGSILAWGAGTTNAGANPQYGQSTIPGGLAGVVAVAGGGYHSLALEGDGRPYITVQPSSQTVAAGATATVAVMVGGAQPLSYQWQRNGASIAGATAAGLSLANVQISSAGTYSVMVTNALGAATSANALLTVIGAPPPPQIDSLAKLPDGKFEIEVGGGPGNFAIESASGLSGWTQLVSLTATGAVFQYIDPDINQASRFYRIRVLP